MSAARAEGCKKVRRSLLRSVLDTMMMWYRLTLGLTGNAMYISITHSWVWAMVMVLVSVPSLEQDYLVLA